MNPNIKDETGKKFGYLLVLSRVGYDKRSNGTIFECQCKCGNISLVRGQDLRRGKVTKCFDCKYKDQAIQQTRNIIHDIPRTYWSHIKRGAQQRGIEFKITPEEAYTVLLTQDRKCALSGVPIFFRDEGTRSHTASLDRINSSIGYVYDNIQWIDKDINKMKNDLDQDRFIAFCLLISEKFTGSPVQ